MIKASVHALFFPVALYFRIKRYKTIHIRFGKEYRKPSGAGPLHLASQMSFISITGRGS